MTWFRYTVLARDLTITPDKETISVGEELRCSAAGNPAPKIILEPMSSAGTPDDNGKSVVMQADWVDSQVTFVCTASNELHGRTEIISRNITVQVVSK